MASKYEWRLYTEYCPEQYYIYLNDKKIAYFRLGDSDIEMYLTEEDDEPVFKIGLKYDFHNIAQCFDDLKEFKEDEIKLLCNRILDDYTKEG